MATDKKPNIVFLLVDNVGWGAFGVYGGMIPTPRIDKLASEGIRFNNYNVEAQCTPTRSAIHTGRSSGSLGDLHRPISRSGASPDWRPGNTRSPNCSPTPATPPRCTASGTWAITRAAAERPGLR